MSNKKLILRVFARKYPSNHFNILPRGQIVMTVNPNQKILVSLLPHLRLKNHPTLCFKKFIETNSYCLVKNPVVIICWIILCTDGIDCMILQCSISILCNKSVLDRKHSSSYETNSPFGKLNRKFMLGATLI